jgi:hypothetical protein
MDQRVPQTTTANLQFLALHRLPSEIRVSHISRKTSEMWGTLWSVVRRNRQSGFSRADSKARIFVALNDRQVRLFLAGEEENPSADDGNNAENRR